MKRIRRVTEGQEAAGNRNGDSPGMSWRVQGPARCRGLPGILDCVVDGARERREAIRQLAGLRRRLAVAEDTLTDALAAMKRAEEAFDAASERFDAAERALDEVREERAQARRDRYAARQAYERASATADRLAQRVRERSERLDRAAELAP